jgi:hypothetical protein
VVVVTSRWFIESVKKRYAVLSVAVDGCHFRCAMPGKAFDDATQDQQKSYQQPFPASAPKAIFWQTFILFCFHPILLYGHTFEYKVNKKIIYI